MATSRPAAMTITSANTFAALRDERKVSRLKEQVEQQQRKTQPSSFTAPLVSSNTTPLASMPTPIVWADCDDENDSDGDGFYSDHERKARPGKQQNDQENVSVAVEEEIPSKELESEDDESSESDSAEPHEEDDDEEAGTDRPNGARESQEPRPPPVLDGPKDLRNLSKKERQKLKQQELEELDALLNEFTSPKEAQDSAEEGGVVEGDSMSKTDSTAPLPEDAKAVDESTAADLNGGSANAAAAAAAKKKKKKKSSADGVVPSCGGSVEGGAAVPLSANIATATATTAPNGESAEKSSPPDSQPVLSKEEVLAQLRQKAAAAKKKVASNKPAIPATVLEEARKKTEKKKVKKDKHMFDR